MSTTFTLQSSYNGKYVEERYSKPIKMCGMPNSRRINNHIFFICDYTKKKWQLAFKEIVESNPFLILGKECFEPGNLIAQAPFKPKIYSRNTG